MNQKGSQSQLYLPTLPSAASAFAILFFMIYTVCTDIVFLRYAVPIFFFFLGFFMTRSRLITAMAGLTALSALFAASADGGSALLLSAVGIIGYGSLSFAYSKPIWWIPAVLVGASVCFWLGGPSSLLLLLCLGLPTLIYGIVFRRQASRMVGIALATAALVLTPLAILAVSVYIRHGEFPSGFIADKIAALRELLLSSMTTFLESYSETLGNNTLLATFDRETLTALINSSIRLLPAILIIVAEIVVYFASFLSLMTYDYLVPNHTLSTPKYGFHIDAVTAILFLLSWLLSSLLGSFEGNTVSILALTATTLYLILLPSAALCGLLEAYTCIIDLTQKRSLTIFILALIFFFLPLYMLSVLAFIGAFHALKTAYSKRKKTQ